MISKQEFEKLFPLAIDWVKQQEEYILKHGFPLTEDQQIDAYLIGVKEIHKVRIWKGTQPPIPLTGNLKVAAKLARLATPNTIGTSFRYGIYLHSDYSNERRLLIHELSHTMQYERFGGIENFLKQYLEECLSVGYPNGFLEQEAKQIEQKICKEK